jgi:hypothetical protein
VLNAPERSPVVRQLLPFSRDLASLFSELETVDKLSVGEPGRSLRWAVQLEWHVSLKRNHSKSATAELVGELFGEQVNCRIRSTKVETQNKNGYHEWKWKYERDWDFPIARVLK